MQEGLSARPFGKALENRLRYSFRVRLDASYRSTSWAYGDVARHQWAECRITNGAAFQVHITDHLRAFRTLPSHVEKPPSEPRADRPLLIMLILRPFSGCALTVSVSFCGYLCILHAIGVMP